MYKVLLFKYRCHLCKGSMFAMSEQLSETFVFIPYKFYAQEETLVVERQ